MTELTQEVLRELVNYEPETGRFTWKASRPACRPGDECGRISSHGYREIGILGKLHHAHRLAVLYMTGHMPSHSVDHINRNRQDNRWCNLRCATQSENMANVVVRKNNTSGVSGVTWDASRKKWRAQIRLNGRKKNLGRFNDLAAAEAAVKTAAREQWGEFAAWAAS